VSAEADNSIVIITGSSGFIGAAAVRRMASSSRVVGFDREGNPNPPKEAECVCVDVMSDQSMRDGLERVRYAYGDNIASVIHLAAYYDCRRRLDRTQSTARDRTTALWEMGSIRSLRGL
jgi:nucleoside-diphosphate-sugar epimerase